jgi:hypothetical protein
LKAFLVCAIVGALPAEAGTRVSVLPFTGPRASKAQARLEEALCRSVQCVARAAPGAQPQSVDAVVSGRVIRSKKKLSLELDVFIGNEVPALKHRYPLEGTRISNAMIGAAVSAIRAKVAEEGADDTASPEPDAQLDFGIAPRTKPKAKAAELPLATAPVAAEASAQKAAPAETVMVAAPASRGPPVLSFVLGGVGAAALGAGALATYWGNKDNAALGQCAPWCQPATVKHIKQLYLGADVSLGVGAVALATGFWLFARSPFSDDEHGYRVDVAATPTGGAVATLSGRF